MAPGARVHSLDAVRGFRPALIRLQEDLSGATGALRQQLNRTLQWLDHDCPSYWQRELRAAFDRVAEARTQLARKQMITVAGHKADCLEEKKALAKAKRRLEIVQEKIQLLRQWSVKAHRVADEYYSRLGRIEQSLAERIPRATVVLERMIQALDAYVTTASPGGLTREADEPNNESPEAGSAPGASL